MCYHERQVVYHRPPRRKASDRREKKKRYRVNTTPERGKKLRWVFWDFKNSQERGVFFNPTDILFHPILGCWGGPPQAHLSYQNIHCHERGLLYFQKQTFVVLLYVTSNIFHIFYCPILSRGGCVNVIPSICCVSFFFLAGICRVSGRFVSSHGCL